MFEVTTALDTLLGYYDKIKHEDVNKVAEKLYALRVSSREAPSSLSWLNNLLRSRIYHLGHHTHPMYMDLLANYLDKAMLENFLSEYYWGSGYGFQREVINLVYKSTPHPSFKNYLKMILKEEQKPRPHFIIFQEFIATLNMTIKDRLDMSVKFVKNQKDGYSSNIYYSLGYALGIEVEADYQIALLTCALSNVYYDEVSNHEFFEIHVDTTGEEAHAKDTCQWIEKLITSDEDIQNVVSGFDKAIKDTSNFMHEIRASL